MTEHRLSDWEIQNRISFLQMKGSPIFVMNGKPVYPVDFYSDFSEKEQNEIDEFVRRSIKNQI